MKRPEIGMSVRLKVLQNGEEVNRAAIITAVRYDEAIVYGDGAITVDVVKLCVFTEDGMYFVNDWIEEGLKPGQWHWLTC